MIYLQLFLSFLQIGAFSFGGGYAAMPLIQNQVVDLHHWLNLSEFTDLVTISGALAATVGCVLPSCILVTLLARIYLKYRDLSIIQGVLKSLRPAVVAMIGAAGVSILVTAFWGLEGFSPNLSALNLRSVCIFAGAVVLLVRFRMSPILVMVLSGAGLIAALGGSWYPDTVSGPGRRRHIL